MKKEDYQKKCKSQGESVVDHPLRYQSKNGIEAIDVIDSFGLNFNLGSAVKYILRLGKKDDEITELEKAKWYIQHEIDVRKANTCAGDQYDA